jgi:uncharacterized membrane protein YesL
MRAFFAPHTDLLEKSSAFIMANLLWLLLCIPLITIPAATAGLFAVFAAWIRGRNFEVISTFFGAVRKYWLKSTLIMLADSMVLVIVLLNATIIARMGYSHPMAILSCGITLFVALFTLLTNIYLWPLLVMFDLPLRDLFTTAAKLVFENIGWSLIVLGLLVTVLVFSLVLPGMALITFTFSACAYVITWGAWRMMKQFVVVSEGA